MKNSVAILILLLTLCIHPDIARAVWPTDGRAISTAGNLQGFPAIVSDGAGGAIIVWVDLRNGNEDIYAQRVDATGTALWTPDGVAVCTAVNNQTFPAIVADGAGGAIVAWGDYRSASANDLYAQRINAAGAVQWLADGVVVCAQSNNQSDPVMIADGAGGAIMTWHDDRLGAWDVFAGRINSSGATVWPVAGVPVCTANMDQDFPTLAPDGSGGAIVSWQDARQPMNFDIYARRIDNAGSLLWTANGNAICSALGHQYKPQIVSDAANGAIIVWSDARVGAVVVDIYAQRVNNAGSAQWAANGVAMCTAANDQYTQMAASDGAGGLITAWWDRRTGAFDVYARRIDVTGTPLWDPDGVAICTATEEQGLPTIIADGSGGAVVTWHDNRTPTNAFDIYAQRVNSAGAVQWTGDGVALCTATRIQSVPVLAADGTGGAIVAWQDLRNGNENNDDDDIYAQRVNAGGFPTAVRPTTPAANLSVGESYPNPFTAETSFDVTLRGESAMSIEVFDAAGRRVRSIDMGRIPAGVTQLAFDGLDNRAHALPSGVYFYRVHAGSETVTKKMVIAR